MSKRNHLGAAKVHGRKAINELRHMTADSALYWVLAHKDRVAKFRRAVKGTRVAKPFDKLLTMIRDGASEMPRRAPRRRKAARTRRASRRKGGIIPPAFLIG